MLIISLMKSTIKEDSGVGHLRNDNVYDDDDMI